MAYQFGDHRTARGMEKTYDEKRNGVKRTVYFITSIMTTSTCTVSLERVPKISHEL
jgi:hypothetical protein